MKNKKFENYLHSLVFTGGSVIKVGNAMIEQKSDGTQVFLKTLEPEQKETKSSIVKKPKQ